MLLTGVSKLSGSGLDDWRRGKSGDRGRERPPVQSSVLRVQKRVWPSRAQTGVAFLETRMIADDADQILKQD